MKRRSWILALLTTLACVAVAAPVSPAAAAFDVASFDGAALDAGGSPATQAGSHPHTASTTFFSSTTVTPGGVEIPTENIKDVAVELPPGLAGNPQAIPTCPIATFREVSTSGTPVVTCPPESQVGTIKIWTVNGNGGSTPGAPFPLVAGLFNLDPPDGTPALLGFTYATILLYIKAEVRSDGDYGIDAISTGASEAIAFSGVTATIWGVPANPAHDLERGACIDVLKGATTGKSCPSADAADPEPFFTLPTSCVGPVATGLTLRSWEGSTATSSFLSHDNATPVPNPIGNSGCEKLDFDPTLAARPTTDVADSPTGLDVRLHVPQPESGNVAGKDHSCTKGTWINSPTGYSYRWLRDGAPIEGAVADAYTSQPADSGHSVQCEVTAAGAGGSGLAVSAPFAVEPAPAVPAPTPGTPVVSGTVDAAGGTVSCEPGNWGGSPSFAYQWFKDGAPVVGETEDEYTAAPGEAPLTLQCRVTGTNSSGAAVAFSAGKASSPAPSPAPPSFTQAPRAIADFGNELPLATAHLKDTTVALPEGIAINPSGANGLGACSSSQAGLLTAVGETPIHFAAEPSGCPDSSKVGSVEVSTPLLDHPVTGAVYVAKPHDNPFDSLLALYISVSDPETGTYATLAGEVEADPDSGRLVTTVEENPQLPLEDIELRIKSGAHAPLVTPPTCGTHTTRSELTSWAQPNKDVASNDSWKISKGPGVGCASSESAVPHLPSFEAGTVRPIAGIHSPFVLNLRRPDGSQRFGTLTVSPPPGLTAKLAGTPPCPEALLAAAERRDGKAEQRDPSCPLASRVGTVHAQAGAGPASYNAPGEAYLAGPYKGAPLSLAIVTPAVAGPFDLGVVVIRTALHVNPTTAQITAVSDPIPAMLEGIPLNVRSASVRLDKPSFSLNPTSCNEMLFGGTLTSTEGAIAQLISRFQLAECGRLGFKPRVSLRLFGGVKRAKYQGLRAVVRPRPGDANISRTVLRFPRSAFVAQEHIRTICTRVQFAADACPKGSIYGKAVATSPLLSYPLEGNVYLRSSNNELPDAVADLRGPAWQPIRVEVAVRNDSVKGALRNTVQVAPDAPVSWFRLNLFGGKKGLIVNSRNICKGDNRATVVLGAHNGARRVLRPRALNPKCVKAKRKAKAKAKKRKRAARR